MLDVFAWIVLIVLLGSTVAVVTFLAMLPGMIAKKHHPSPVGPRLVVFHLFSRSVDCLGHGVLLVLGAPCQLLSLAGQEHGRTIPLEVDMGFMSRNSVG